MRALLVYNPAATTTSPGLVDVVIRSLRAEVKLDVEATRHQGHATTLAADAVHGGHDVVVALGGDGTINEVVQAVACTPVKLAVLPGGHTNVFARALGLPRDPAAAAEAVVAHLRAREDRTMSLGRADDRFFTFCAGLGYDAEVVRMVERRPRLRGIARVGTYFYCGALAIAAGRAQAAPITVHTDGEDPSPGLYNAICCNLDPYSFAWRLPSRMCPRADGARGLDLTAMSQAGAGDLVRLATTALTSDRVPRLPFARSWHDHDRYVLTSATPLPLQVDGEYIGEHRQVELRSVRRALTVVAPQSS